jgi:hypothetical protein
MAKIEKALRHAMSGISGILAIAFDREASSNRRKTGVRGTSGIPRLDLVHTLTLFRRGYRRHVRRKKEES